MIEQGFNLLKSEKKKLWDMLNQKIETNAGFELKKDGLNLIISHKEGYYFKMIYRTDAYFCTVVYFPCSDGYKEFTDNCLIFPSLALNFGKWLDLTKTEIESEDVWNNQHTGFTKFECDNNEKFSKEEQEQIKDEINQLKLELAEKEELKECLNQINIKLDLLGELVGEMSKVSWRDHIIGSVMGLTVDKIVSSKTASFIGEKISTIFNNVCDKLYLG